MAITVLTEAELRQCVSVDREAIDAVAAGFTALAGGGVVMPPVVHLHIEEHAGEMDVKTAYVPGFDSFALKVSTGFFENPKRGLPSLSGMMTLISSETGQVRAVLLDNGYLTDVRTAAAGAVAAEVLAREDARTAGVLGTGLQARLQMRALALVRPIERVLAWGRNADEAEAYAREIRETLGIAVEARSDPAEVVREADAVVTTTPAKQPILKAEWLHPGLHVTAMGSDSADKNEVEPQALARADRLVCDKREQCLRLGELHHAVEAGAVPEDVEVTELGQITSGNRPGRRTADEVTLADLTGTGVQDTAIATVAFRKATERGFGVAIEG